MYMTTRVNFRLPDDLVEKADVAADVTHRDRTAIVVEALRRYLEDVEQDERFREAVVELYLEDEVGFDVLKQVVGVQDAEALRASKSILEHGDEIAEEIADL